MVKSILLMIASDTQMSWGGGKWGRQHNIFEHQLYERPYILINLADKGIETCKSVACTYGHPEPAFELGLTDSNSQCGLLGKQGKGCGQPMLPARLSSLTTGLQHKGAFCWEVTKEWPLSLDL